MTSIDHSPRLDFDQALLTPAYLADPYPYYRALRDNDPVHWSPRMNAWVLTRYEDVFDALSDARLISGRRVETYANQLPGSTQPSLKPLFDQVDHWMGNMDPPNHTRLRKLVNKVFTPNMVEGLRPDIEQFVTELLDAIEAGGGLEFVGDFAYPLPAIVIANMLGVPPEDRNRFMRWSDDLTAYVGTGQPDLAVAEEASQSAAELTDFFRQLAAQRRIDPRDDLISSLVQLEDEGETLTEWELLGMCGFLLVAGHETTMGLLSNGMLALLRNPNQLERLRHDVDLTASAVEEMLRFDSSIQHQTRVASERMEMNDRMIEEGDRVIAFIGAANRDPEQFPNPDRFDIARSPNKHLAFGYGIHFCLGAPLARLEAQIAFPMILKRFPQLQLKPEPFKNRLHTSNRNPLTLPLEIGR